MVWLVGVTAVLEHFLVFMDGWHGTVYVTVGFQLHERCNYKCNCVLLAAQYDFNWAMFLL
jgi:hypothetical protein